MSIVKPAPDLASRLAELELPSSDGKRMKLGSLWTTRRVVLVHLRHFGCLFCRGQAQHLAEKEQEILEQGGTIVAIGTGDMKYAQEFKQQLRLNYPVLVDEPLRTYHEIGAGKGHLTQWATPGMLLKTVTAIRNGAAQARLGPAPNQLGGTHVIGPGGEITFAWVNADPGNNPPMEEVLAAVSAEVAPKAV